MGLQINVCKSGGGANGLLLPKLTNKAFPSFPLAFDMARETTPVGFFFFFRILTTF